MIDIRFNRLLPMLGFRRRPRHYAYSLENIDLGEGESVQCARWLHPKVSPLSELITPAVVAGYRTLVKQGDFCLDIGAYDSRLQTPEVVNHRRL